MDEHDPQDQDFPDLERRLAEFGSAPLDPAVAGRALERVHARGRRKLSGARLKLVSAAAIAGFAAGGVGLAAANVLPAPAQDVAHSALETVGVHVPPGHVRYNDPTVCPGGPYANHGAYVRAHKDDPNAGASPCGKPVRSVDPSGKAKNDDTNDGDANDDTNGKSGKTNKGNGHGPPPWAHGNGKPDKQDPESDDADPTTKPTTTTPTTSSSTSTSSTTATSTASTTTTSASTASTTSTTMQP
jgi:hypothetical protein